MKKLNYWILMLLACVSVGFLSACSEDDDEPGSGSSGSGTSIVGAWFDEDGGELIFSKNGTYREYYDGEVEESGTYKISDDLLILKDEYGDRNTYTIVTLSKTKLYLEEEDGDICHWYRSDDGDADEDDDDDYEDNNDNVSERQIVGTWEMQGDDDDITFYSNGTYRVRSHQGYYSLSGSYLYLTGGYFEGGWKVKFSGSRMTLTCYYSESGSYYEGQTLTFIKE